MGRKKLDPNVEVISIRFPADDINHLREIAALETLNTGFLVTSAELIRQAVRFVYEDNERLRESFRRAKQVRAREYKITCD